ncbi:Uncharacterised protein [Mycobacteroides abscessus]|nr:Uncharacterised protein [Mycobacteroides abscessus]
MLCVQNHGLLEGFDDDRIWDFAKAHPQEVGRIAQMAVWLNRVKPTTAAHIGRDDGREHCEHTK